MVPRNSRSTDSSSSAIPDHSLADCAFKVESTNLNPSSLIQNEAVSQSDKMSTVASENTSNQLDILKIDHANALCEAQTQATQQYGLNQLFVTALFTAFGLAFEKRIELVFAILPLFGGMCVVTLYWKDVIWYLAIKRVIEIEQQINNILGEDRFIWGHVHGEAYMDYGASVSLKRRFGLERLRHITATCYVFVVIQYILVLGASIVLWANAPSFFGDVPLDATSKIGSTRLEISSPLRYTISFFHLTIFGIALHLWRQRRLWQAEITQ